MNTTLPSPDLADSTRFLEGKKIFVIDDDKALLTAVTKALRQHGARVTGVASVSEALRVLARGYGSHDLVLTDMRMPITSGKFILSALRSATPPVPTIVMTAYATQTMCDECAMLGAASLIEKPFDTAALISLIRQVLQNGKAA